MSMIGKSLAHYSITSQIGKGGMGEVYQAKDQKLGRDVAIKVLPEEFAKDTDRVARFQREAKLLASLNHPNIASIHGLEESEGQHFLVLELIKGDNLAERIKSGPIPVEEALKLALQITEALEAAHEKGVIHRDLKPANIKVTPEGKVKVLDFGLAKAFTGEQADLNLSNSPTLSDMATQQGLILGTAAYMSPEQARGKHVDKRTDVWAFGCVLYEMLTGKQVFTGDTVSDTLASVLAREPEYQSLPQNLHPRIRLLLERCLKKESNDRYSGISDARVDIQEALADPSGVLERSVMTDATQRKKRTMLMWIAISLIAGLIIAGVAVWIFKPFPPPEPKRVVRFEHYLPADQQFDRRMIGNQSLAVSPDGIHFVYGTTEGLYLRAMNETEVRHIPGTDENSRDAFFSPDNQWICYESRTDNELKKIHVNGTAPVSLCDTRVVVGATWYDDTIVFASLQDGIMRVSSEGGTPEPLIKLKQDDIGAYVGPQFLPDGKAFLFAHWQPPDSAKILVYTLESGEIKELIPGNSPRYLPTGHLVYQQENNLYAARFDLNTLEVKGGSVHLLENAGIPSISDKGTLVYRAEIPDIAPGVSLFWVDREGNETPLDVEPNVYEDLSISPDGTRVALGIEAFGISDILIYDLDRKNMIPFATDDTDDQNPLWALPDGERIIFESDREGVGGIYWRASDRSGTAEQIIALPKKGLTPWSVSDDGKTLLVMESDGFGENISMISMEDNFERGVLLQETYNEKFPQISPDGRWMAYVTDETRQEEVYVRQIPDVKNSGPVKVSTNGGTLPLWSPNSQELYYRKGDSFMAVSFEIDTTFQPGMPEALFKGPYREWDIHPDGKRFLMTRALSTNDEESAVEAPRKIDIVLNWFEELKQKVPTD